MIYPLEAVGYEESVKSPYLDMLNDFRSSLRTDNVIFVIGYSLRDPIIGSIFEEVIAERIRRGDLSPFAELLDSRTSGTLQHKFKILVVNPEPHILAENLKKQFNNNLLNTFIPIEIEFPKIGEEFGKNYAAKLVDLIEGLLRIGYMNQEKIERVVPIVQSKYGIDISQALTPY